MYEKPNPKIHFTNTPQIHLVVKVTNPEPLQFSNEQSEKIYVTTDENTANQKEHHKYTYQHKHYGNNPI